MRNLLTVAGTPTTYDFGNPLMENWKRKVGYTLDDAQGT